MDRDRFEAVIAAVDAANAEDPTEVELDGEVGPKELLHARMATTWLDRLDPDADELQHVAVRAHHLRRWASPRDEYPPGRAGYLRWRTAANEHQAAEVGELMRSAGFSDDEVERVAAIVRKDASSRGRASEDRTAQVHEDALCLVFLRTQLIGVADRLGDDAAVDVVAKTMRKMSADGLGAAAALDLDERGRSLLDRAALLHAGSG